MCRKSACHALSITFWRTLHRFFQAYWMGYVLQYGPCEAGPSRPVVGTFPPPVHQERASLFILAYTVLEQATNLFIYWWSGKLPNTLDKIILWDGVCDWNTDMIQAELWKSASRKEKAFQHAFDSVDAEIYMYISDQKLSPCLSDHLKHRNWANVADNKRISTATKCFLNGDRIQLRFSSWN